MSHTGLHRVLMSLRVVECGLARPRVDKCVGERVEEGEQNTNLPATAWSAGRTGTS